MREADAYTILNEPILSINLMERAANKCVEWIVKNFDADNNFKIFVGTGNNGGDGLAIARILATKHKVEVFIIELSNKSADFVLNLERLKKQNLVKITVLNKETNLPIFKEKDIIIDAIFGYGLTRELEINICKTIDFINNCKNKVVAIDIPSGIAADFNLGNNICKIKADWTLTFEMPFLSFFLKENIDNIGELVILPLGINHQFIENLETNYFYTIKKEALDLVKFREKITNKWDLGHGLLIAGSYGKMGAAVLSAKASIRSGIGLLTAITPKCGYQIMQISIPEVMTIIDENQDMITILPELDNYNAIAVGPGIGQFRETAKLVAKLISNCNKKIVFDADAINIIATNRELMGKINDNHIFTPHIKEFERLIGKKSNDSLEILKWQREFSTNYNCTIVLKGANSSISLPNGDIYFNSSGNSGMATAGCGDVLTGVILSLLAQNYSTKDAAILGTFFHGYAADLAIKKQSKESLIASDIIENFKGGFNI